MKYYMQKVLVIASLLFLFNISIASASDTYVKIGLSAYQNQGQVVIKDKNIQVGFSLDGSFNAEINESAENFTVKTSGKTYIKINERFYDYQTAKKSVQTFASQGYPAMVAYSDNNTFFVYLAYNDAVSANKASSNIFRENTVLVANSNRFELLANSKTIVCFDSNSKKAQIKSNDGVVHLSNNSYRNLVEFSASSKGLNTVNLLNLEEYLYGVMPAEVPASWPKESLKAQALAARTYAHSRIAGHASDGYDLCDTVHCQVYKGYSAEDSRTTVAVNETKGKKIYHNGNLINAVFFASSGGKTEDSENVWQTATPYLKSVNEVNETKDSSWSRTFTMNDIKSMLAAKNVHIGDIKRVEILSYTLGGRVAELRFHGTKGTKSVIKEEIRTIFSSSPNGSLRSRVFSFKGSATASNNNSVPIYAINSENIITKVENGINSVINSSNNLSSENLDSAYLLSANGLEKVNFGAESDSLLLYNNASYVSNTFTLSGVGYGHGVGMSQEGAKGMAEAGYNYIDILKHYYTGVEIF